MNGRLLIGRAMLVRLVSEQTSHEELFGDEDWEAKEEDRVTASMKQKQQEGARLADAAAKKGSKAQQIAAIKAKVRADSIDGPSPRVAGLNTPCCRAAGRDRGGGRLRRRQGQPHRQRPLPPVLKPRAPLQARASRPRPRRRKSVRGQAGGGSSGLWVSGLRASNAVNTPARKDTANTHSQVLPSIDSAE